MGSSVLDTGLKPYLKSNTMKSVLFVLGALAISANGLKCDINGETKACSNAKAYDVCKCRSQKLEDAAQYKCAVMYENLPKKTGEGERGLTWLGAMPDALRRPSIRDSTDPELKASFGGVEAKSFWWRKAQPDYETDKCNRIRASSKCYAAMIEPTEKLFDECAVNIINEDNETKVTNINIGMYFSYCGKDWEVIESEGVPLRLAEPLCCKRDS